MIRRNTSPLRYPGGKGVLTHFLASIIIGNNIDDCVYVEPYAGGSGAATNLLLSGFVNKIILNDIDYAVYSFWRTLKNEPGKLIDRIMSVDISVREWKRQRQIYENYSDHDYVDVGFATLFLNRCNRSGIIAHAGVIGGLDQSGKWKIDARFNRNNLADRISKIAKVSDMIELHNMDAMSLMQNLSKSKKFKDNHLIYLDPPYYVKGCQLYLNSYKHDDHEALAAFLKKENQLRWIASYDNVPEIACMYSWALSCDFSIGYSASHAKTGNEIMFFSDKIKSPCFDILLECK